MKSEIPSSPSKALEHARQARKKIEEARETLGRISIAHIPPREAVRGHRELATALARLVTENKGATAQQIRDLASLADAISCALEGGTVR